MSNYEVNGKGYDSYLQAVAVANVHGATVSVIYPDGSKREVWKPAPVSTKRRTRHVLVSADGTKTEFGKVTR